MKQKYVTEWLKELPEPFSKLALKNRDCPDEAVETCLEYALAEAFIWSSSPEGLDYWSNIYNSIRSGQFPSSLSPIDQKIAEYNEAAQKFQFLNKSLLALTQEEIDEIGDNFKKLCALHDKLPEGDSRQEVWIKLKPLMRKIKEPIVY